jgi:hypothetical protein
MASVENEKIDKNWFDTITETPNITINVGMGEVTSRDVTAVTNMYARKHVPIEMYSAPKNMNTLPIEPDTPNLVAFFKIRAKALNADGKKSLLVSAI